MSQNESNTNKSHHNSVPLSFKIAVATGAIAGATITIITHKEEVLQVAETILEAGEQLLLQGAEFCRTKLEEVKQANAHFADGFEDHEYQSAENLNDDDEVAVVNEEHAFGRSTGVSTSGSQSDYDEQTTPSASSDEDDYEDWDRESIEVQSLD